MQVQPLANLDFILLSSLIGSGMSIVVYLYYFTKPIQQAKSRVLNLFTSTSWLSPIRSEILMCMSASKLDHQWLGGHKTHIATILKLKCMFYMVAWTVVLGFHFLFRYLELLVLLERIRWTGWAIFLMVLSRRSARDNEQA